MVRREGRRKRNAPGSREEKEGVVRTAEFEAGVGGLSDGVDLGRSDCLAGKIVGRSTLKPPDRGISQSVSRFLQ